MELSEFFESLGRTEMLYKQLKQQQKEFREQLAVDLLEFVFSWYPHYANKRAKLEKSLLKIAQKYSDEVWECFNLAEYRSRKGLPGKEESAVSKLKSRKEAETELQEFLHLIPPEDIEYAKQIHWESFEEDQQSQKFLLEIHRIMKKNLIDKYLNSVLELDSDYLRLLDSYIYTTAFTFADDWYTLLED